MSPSITDWFMVVITGIYVVATIFICVFNWKTTKVAEAQTEEIRKQFVAVNRPIINVEIAYLKRQFWVLRLSNQGALTAFNTKIIIDDTFINSLPEKNFREILLRDSGRTRTIGVNQQYDLFFGTNKYRKAISKVPLRGQVVYEGINGAIYAEDFEIGTHNYATFYSVDSDVDDLKKKLSEQNRELKKIEEEIRAIRKYFESEGLKTSPEQYQDSIK